jgi:hypothetical protein
MLLMSESSCDKVPYLVRSVYGKRAQEFNASVEPSKCILSQNGDLIFDAMDYQQNQYCVEASGETYSKENDERETSQPTSYGMHAPR